MQVPEGWEKVRLDKVAEIRTGVAKSRKKIIDPIDVPYLRVANVQDGHINLDEVKTITIERHQLERYSLVAGDVLMNEGGDFDKLGRGDVWQGQIEPCLHQNHVFSVRPNQEKLNSYFLAALAASHYGKIYFLSCAKRSTNLASINSTQVKQFPVLVPPLEEQQKIAQILSTWDKAITTTEQLLANSQQQKKALMQQLLAGKKRLLDDGGQKFNGEWKFFVFEQVFSVTNKKTAQVKTSDIQESGIYPVVDQGQKFIAGYTSQDETYTDTPVIVFGDHTRCVKWIDFEFCPGADGTQVLKAKFDSKFCYYVLLNTDIPNLGYSRHMRELKEKDFKLPQDEKEQQKIAAVLTTADQEIFALEKKLEHLKQKKRALMQQLLTGNKRVKKVQGGKS